MVGDEGATTMAVASAVGALEEAVLGVSEEEAVSVVAVHRGVSREWRTR